MTAPSPAPLCFSAMAGTFPGAPSIDALWKLLRQGQRAPQQDLLERWRMARDSIHHPAPARWTGSTCTRSMAWAAMNRSTWPAVASWPSAAPCWKSCWPRSPRCHVPARR